MNVLGYLVVILLLLAGIGVVLIGGGCCLIFLFPNVNSATKLRVKATGDKSDNAKITIDGSTQSGNDGIAIKENFSSTRQNAEEGNMQVVQYQHDTPLQKSTGFKFYASMDMISAIKGGLHGDFRSCGFLFAGLGLILFLLCTLAALIVYFFSTNEPSIALICLCMLLLIKVSFLYNLLLSYKRSKQGY
jgi:hypothetical protein